VTDQEPEQLTLEDVPPETDAPPDRVDEDDQPYPF
jgi:hypothetical protein